MNREDKKMKLFKVKEKLEKKQIKKRIIRNDMEQGIYKFSWLEEKWNTKQKQKQEKFIFKIYK